MPRSERVARNIVAEATSGPPDIGAHSQAWEKTRLQIDLNPEELARLNALLAKCQMKTKAAFFDNLTTLAEWVVDKLEKGLLIGAINEANDSYIELQMPFFSKVKRRDAA
jgi:hypothetical protein